MTNIIIGNIFVRGGVAFTCVAFAQ